MRKNEGKWARPVFYAGNLCYSCVVNFDAYKSQIASLAQKFNLQFVALFGSQATGATHAKSDIDIAVISRSKIDKTKISIELDEIFKRDDTEVVNLASADPTLMYAVVRDGILLYEKNNGDFLRWKFYAIKIWMETAWLRELGNKKLIERVKNY